MTLPHTHSRGNERLGRRRLKALFCVAGNGWIKALSDSCYCMYKNDYFVSSPNVKYRQTIKVYW
ncbi:MAG: hypothetical protein GWP06_01585 [Actinobacteria bacterium]|nr:hypothetical protein [Actinomycetota bacterium]